MSALARLRPLALAFGMGAFFVRIVSALLVFAVSLVVFWIAIGLLAYRLPAFGERVIIEGITEPRKIDTGNRTLFETPFGRGMVPLDENTELYLPKAGNPWIGWNSPRYRVIVSASPLMFGGYADAQLISVERLGEPTRPLPPR